jgi:uncharacterized OB-fold protein
VSPDAAPATSWILPDLDDEIAAPFWAGTARGELLVQTCAQCGLRRMPPRPMCPRCRSLDHTWVASSGRGTVWSFAVPHPPLLPAYAELAPYNVVIVALDEDPTIRFVGNLVATEGGPIDELDPATIEIGEPVRVTYARIDDVTLPRWMRA